MGVLKKKIKYDYNALILHKSYNDNILLSKIYIHDSLFIFNKVLTKKLVSVEYKCEKCNLFIFLLVSNLDVH